MVANCGPIHIITWRKQARAFQAGTDARTFIEIDKTCAPSLVGVVHPLGCDARNAGKPIANANAINALKVIQAIHHNLTLDHPYPFVCSVFGESVQSRADVPDSEKGQKVIPL
jgi:hypothetical protein